MVEKGIPPSQILAVTFTNKAANEMLERVCDMVSKKAGKEMTVCTFHSLCVRILRMGIDRLGYKPNFTIYTGNDQKGLISRIIISKGGINEKLKPGEVLAMISNAKNTPEGIAGMTDDFIADIAQAYQNELRAQNAVDFDDLLVLGEQLLREFPEVRDRCRKRWTRVTVDEFQDTNKLQMRLLQQLVDQPYHVCVVGDDDQSIYGWRGAEAANILEFERFFPNPEVILLETNYRSSEAIIHTANSLIVIMWADGKSNSDLIKPVVTISGSFQCRVMRRKRSSLPMKFQICIVLKKFHLKMSPFCSARICRAGVLSRRCVRNRFLTV